jgi:ABC-2 type transport system permease protein
MTNVVPIFKKELRSYFSSPVAYIFITMLLLFCGYFFASSLFLQGQASLRGFFQIVPFVLSLLVPAVTMRLISEEKKSGTFELLTTMPVANGEIIVGKYLAALVLLAGFYVFSLPYAFTVGALGNMDVGATVSGYFGLLLLGAGYLAVGILASSLTENQIIAFIVALFATLALSLVDKMLIILPKSGATVLEYLSAEYHFNNIARGVIDTRDLVYYASLIVLGLYFSARALQRRF